VISLDRPAGVNQAQPNGSGLLSPGRVGSAFSGKVGTGLPLENAPFFMARIPIAKPESTFAEYARSKQA
jgi:hypothetical protein